MPGSWPVFLSWLRWVVRAIGWCREFAPYALIELVLPGGSLLALALWLYRRRRSQTVPLAERLIPLGQ
ncbi:MAG TPA: hypothetical protein VHY75_13460 [Steroidobacteraceae bacterium]|jgi:hypothetical protein|nr:hypothetical protein [Steroidobacteraceae bacterium]